MGEDAERFQEGQGDRKRHAGVLLGEKKNFQRDRSLRLAQHTYRPAIAYGFEHSPGANTPVTTLEEWRNRVSC